MAKRGDPREKGQTKLKKKCLGFCDKVTLTAERVEGTSLLSKYLKKGLNRRSNASKPTTTIMCRSNLSHLPLLVLIAKLIPLTLDIIAFRIGGLKTFHSSENSEPFYRKSKGKTLLRPLPT